MASCTRSAPGRLCGDSEEGTPEDESLHLKQTHPPDHSRLGPRSSGGHQAHHCRSRVSRASEKSSCMGGVGAEGWWLGGPQDEQSACPSGQPVTHAGQGSHQRLFWKSASGPEASLPSPVSCCWGQKHSRVPRVSVAQGKAPYSGSDARGSGPEDLQLAQAGVPGQPSVLVFSTGLTTPARLP